MNKNSIGFDTINSKKQRIKHDGFSRAARYNYTVMKDEIVSYEAGFAENLAKLRSQKGISAREMSLSLGQGASYINDIENGRNLPSMPMFFEICEFLEITPSEFFSYMGEHYLVISDTNDQLDNDDIELLNRIIKRLQK